MKVEIGGLVPSAWRNVFLLTIIRVAAVGGSAIVPGMREFLRPYEASVWTVEGYFIFAMLVSIVPSGILADFIGQKLVIQLGGFSLVLGAVTYVQADSVSGFCFAETLLGTGQGLILGKDESLMRSSLARIGREKDFDRFWGFAIGCEVIACAFNFYYGEYLSGLNRRAPFVYAGSSYAILFLAGILLHKEKVERGFSGEKFRVAYGTAMRSAKLWSAIGWYTLFAAVLRIGFWSSSSYLSEIESTMPVGRLLSYQCALSGSIAIGLGLAGFGRPLRFIGRPLTWLMGLVFVSLGFVSGEWALGILFVHPVIRAMSRVIYTSAVQDEIDAVAPEFRTAITSLREMCYLAVYFLLVVAAQTASHSWGTPGMLAALGTAVLFVLSLVSAGSLLRADKG